MVRKFLVAQQYRDNGHVPEKLSSVTILPEEVNQRFPQAATFAKEKGAVVFHGRCVVDGRTYFSMIYSRGMARSSRFICYSACGQKDNFGEVIYYFSVTSGERYCVLREFLTERPLYKPTLDVTKRFTSHTFFHFICKESSSIVCIPANAIISRCCILVSKGCIFVTPVLLDYEMQ
jgi:hypothetical protein